MDVALQQLRQRVVEAHAAKSPLRLRGAGTKDFYGERLDGAPLDMRSYRGVVEYEPSELVLTARCGTPLSEVEELLHSKRQFLAFEPPAFGGDPTIGGIVASGLSGPRRSQAGAVRDFVLGAVLLPAHGEPLHLGGKVIKNVAGFDIARLLCGSLGILGAILEVSIKVLPVPPAQATLRFELPLARALESFNRWGGEPLPISATAWWRGQAWVRLSGAQAAVSAARAGLGGEPLEAQVAEALWRSLREQTHEFFRASPALWRLSVPSTAPPLPEPTAALIEWGGALRWYASSEPAAHWRALAAAAGGTALHWRGGEAGQRFHPLSASVLALHRRLKARLDPHGIFNPGRLVVGL